MDAVDDTLAQVVAARRKLAGFRPKPFPLAAFTATVERTAGTAS